jgi:hypothetical protein
MSRYGDMSRIQTCLAAGPWSAAAPPVGDAGHSDSGYGSAALIWHVPKGRDVDSECHDFIMIWDPDSDSDTLDVLAHTCSYRVRTTFIPCRYTMNVTVLVVQTWYKQLEVRTSSHRVKNQKFVLSTSGFLPHATL